MSTELNKEEEIQQRAFNLGLTLQLLGYLKPHRGHVILAFGTIALAAGFGQVGPYITQVAVDDYIAIGDWAGLRWMIAAFFGSVAVQYGAQYAQTLVTGMIGQRVMYDMRRDLFAHLQKLPLRYFDRTPLGRVMTRATNDIDALNEFFSEGVVSVFMDLFTLLAIVGFMAYIDLELALICCTVVPVIAVSTFYLQGLAIRAYRELRTRLARLNAYLQENITGVEVVQLFNRQQRNLRDFDAEHLPYRRAEDREIHFYAIFFPFTELLGTVGMVLVLWYGASDVIDGRIELGVLVAFLQYIRRFFRPIMDISDRYALLQSAMAASERIFELLAVPGEPTGGPQRNLPTAQPRRHRLNSATCSSSTIQQPKTGSSRMSRLNYRPGRAWRWSGPPARARPPSSASSAASTTSSAGKSSSMAATCASGTRPSCAAASASSSRRSSYFLGISAATSASGRTPSTTPKSSARPATSTPRPSSNASPKALPTP